MSVLVIITILFFIGYGPLYWSATPAVRAHIGPGFLASYFLPLYLGVIFPHAFFFMPLVFVLFLTTTRNRLDAACRFVLLALLLPAVVWRMSIGSAYLTDVDTLAVLAIGLLVKCLIAPDRQTRPMRRLTIEDAFVAILFLALWLGGQRDTSISVMLRGGFDQGLLLLLPYLALRQSIRSSHELMRVAVCFAVAAALLALFAVYEALNGWTLFGVFRDVSDTIMGNKNLIQRGGALRAPVTMSGALMLSVVLLIGFTAGLYSRRYVRLRWMIVGWCTVIFLGIVMTQSRGNLALFPLAGMIFCVMRRKMGYAVMIAIGGLAGIGGLYALTALSPQVAAFLHVGDTGGPELTATVYDYRQLLLTRGLQVAAMNPLTGAGMRTVLQQMADITQGQGIVDLVNTYLTIYLVSGLAGFAPFIVLLAMIWKKLVSARVNRFGQQELIDMRAFALTTLAVETFQLAFMSFIDRLPFCLALTLVATRLVGLEAARFRRERKQAAAKAAFDALPLAPARQAARRPATPFPDPGPGLTAR